MLQVDTHHETDTCSVADGVLIGDSAGNLNKRVVEDRQVCTVGNTINIQILHVIVAV